MNSIDTMNIPARTSEPETTLREFLDQFDTQARHGFCPGPRYRIPYTVMGEGEPVYVVPGICAPRRLLAPLVVELAREFRVVIHDLAGVDRGDGAKLGNYRLEDYPNDLLHLAEQLGDERFCVIGNSFGATITLRAMHNCPARIAKAMLVGGFVSRPLSKSERLLFGMLRCWPGRLRGVPFLKSVSRYNHQRELDFRESTLIDFLISEHGSVPVRTAASQLLAVDRTDLRELASQIQQPSMVVHGVQDRLVPTQHSADLADRLPNVRIMLIPRCGHVPHLSHPELLAHACRKFFADKP